MWCSFQNLGGQLCANRRCLRDRSTAGVDQSATRKRAAPVRLGTSPTAQPRKARAVGAGRSKTPLKPENGTSRRKNSPPTSPTSPKALPTARTAEEQDAAWPTASAAAGKAAIHMAVAALRQTKPLKAEPLSPRSAARLTECCQFADLLKVEQRSGTNSSPSSPLARSSSRTSHTEVPQYTLEPALSEPREAPTCALAPKLAFKLGLARQTSAPLVEANSTYPVSRVGSIETNP